MAIPTIMKGDDAEAIPFTAPEAVVELLAVYQGVTRRFPNVAQGAALSISFTAAETARFELGTFPLVFAVKYADGRAKSYPLTAKVKVTDSPALVYGTAVDVDPGGGKPLDGVDPLPERHTMDDVAEKVNEVIRKLSSGAAATALALCLSAFGATIQTAPLGQLYNDARVVTNVIFDAAPDFSTNNAALVATIEAKAPAPGNYAAVSNAAMSAAGQIAAATDAMNSATNALTAAIDGKRDKMDLVYRNTTHNGIEKWAVQIQSESVTLLAEWNEEIQRWFNQDPPVYGLGIRIASSGYIFSTTGGEFPFALSGDSATVSDGWYTFTLTPVMYPDDRLALMNDIPTISAWAKAANKPTYTASEVGATTPADVTAAIREQSLGGIWDEALQVWWTPRMRNGSLTYEATTNVNINAEN